MAFLFSPVVFISSIPPVTRSFTAATVVFSFLYAWLRWNGAESTPYLTLLPGSSLFYPWTFVTSALVETSIPEVCAIFRSNRVLGSRTLRTVRRHSHLRAGVVEIFGEAMG